MSVSLLVKALPSQNWCPCLWVQGSEEEGGLGSSLESFTYVDVGQPGQS